MALLTTLGLIAGGASAVSNFISGSQMRREAEMNLDKFKHQELTNLADALQPSLEAERQAISQIDKSMATFADLAGTMDAATSMAILGQGQQQTAAQGQQVFASIMDKDFQADLARVQDEGVQRQMIENRRMEELQSLKQQAQAGAQMQAKGLSDVANLAVSAGTAIDVARAEAGDTDPQLRRQAERDARKAARESKRQNKAIVEYEKIAPFLNNALNLFGGFFPTN